MRARSDAVIRVARRACARATTDAFVVGATGLWIVLVGVPLLGLVLFSVFRVRGFTLTFEPTFASYLGLIESGRSQVVLRTLRVAALVTAIELAIGFPFAFWLAKQLRSVPLKVAILTLTVVPFFLSSAARAIVWRPILSSTGLINTLLVGSGLSSQPVEWLLFSEVSVHFGLVLLFFPSMLFPLFMSISLIDDEYLAASADLGATPSQTLWTVILPLAAPGIMAGIVFTIVPMLGEVAVPQLLGGGNVNLLGESAGAAVQSLNYGTGAAMCTLVLLLLLVLLALLLWIARRSGLLSGGFGILAR